MSEVGPKLSNVVSYLSAKFGKRERVTRGDNAIVVHLAFEPTGFGDGYFVKAYAREDGGLTDLTEVVSLADQAGEWKYGISSELKETAEKHKWVTIIFFFDKAGADSVFLASLALTKPSACEDLMRD